MRIATIMRLCPGRCILLKFHRKFFSVRLDKMLKFVKMNEQFPTRGSGHYLLFLFILCSLSPPQWHISYLVFEEQSRVARGLFVIHVQENSFAKQFVSAEIGIGEPFHF